MTNEALIKIKSVGICGLDINPGVEINHFLVIHVFLGHEICGEIVGLG
ncbi:alcohol dehydrogenase catalytic domain-containing protein [Escherichia coli]